MIIEATQTFSPGNVELLIYLLNKIEQRGITCTVYLGHDHTYNLLEVYRYNNIIIEKTNAFHTVKRFLKKRENVIFFCSYPPISKQKNSVVYFHSSFFINPFKFLKNKKIPTKNKLVRLFVYCLIRFFHKNVDYFYCQTNAIENELINSFSGIKVKKMPFFNDIDLIHLKHEKHTKFKYDFFYPATPDVHKNHFKLFDAVVLLSINRKVSVCVTIDPKAKSYQRRIDEVNNIIGYEAIINVGRVSKNTVLELYMKSKAMIFPSLEESLGLPLIEASYISCPILGSDLPYIYEVVENPIVFNPFDVQDIADKMNAFLQGEYESYIQKNKIDNVGDKIINYFDK